MDSSVLVRIHRRTKDREVIVALVCGSSITSVTVCWLIYSYTLPWCSLLITMFQAAFRPWLLEILFPFPQSISPGLVRTEFLGRASNAKDLEQSKKYYDKICAEVHHIVYSCLTLTVNTIALCLLCLLTVYRYWKQKILQVQYCIPCPHLQECRYHCSFYTKLGIVGDHARIQKAD